MKPLSDRRLCDVPLRARALPAQWNLGGRYRKGGEAPLRVGYGHAHPLPAHEPDGQNGLGPGEVGAGGSCCRRRRRPVSTSRSSLAEGPAAIECAYDAGAGRAGADPPGVRAPRRRLRRPVIGCYSDPGLEALREMLDIPVIGPGAAPCILPPSSARASAHRAARRWLRARRRAARSLASASCWRRCAASASPSWTSPATARPCSSASPRRPGRRRARTALMCSCSAA